jgi:hypothetical protein
MMSSNMMMGQVNEFRYGDVLLTHWVAKSRARSIQVVSCHSIFLSFHYLSLGLAFTQYPLFQWHLQSKEILLNFSMKCWNPAFDAQGLRVIIIVVQVRVVKIHM